MTTSITPERELTPNARIERAKRKLAGAIEELIEAKVAAVSSVNAWVDQHHSPLGKRRHLELCRAKQLPYVKDGKLRLVRSSDLTAFLEAKGVRVANEDEGVDDVIAAIEKGGRRR